MTVEVRPFASLGKFEIDWLKARHHFSFGQYHDPERMGVGPLRVWNDDRDRAGHRLRSAPAPRHGDHHLCPARRRHASRQPRQRGPHRRGRRPGDVGRHRHRARRVQPATTSRSSCSRSGSSRAPAAWRRAGRSGPSRPASAPAPWSSWPRAARATTALCRSIRMRRCSARRLPPASASCTRWARAARPTWSPRAAASRSTARRRSRAMASSCAARAPSRSRRWTTPRSCSPTCPDTARARRSHGPAGRRHLARPPRAAKQGRPLRPHRDPVSQLDHAGRQPRPDRRGRLQGRAWPLPSVRVACLPLGAPHADHAQAQGPGGRDRRVRGALAHRGSGLGVQGRPGCDRRSPLWPRLSAPGLYPGAGPTTPGASRCRSCGTRSGRRSSTTNWPRSSAC